MFDCLVLCKPIITYIWLSVCLISIIQSLLFIFHWFLWKLAYIFSLVVWLFDSRQTKYNVNVYDWKQTCLHLAFRFITFVMHFIFTIFFVRPQPCMLEFGREFFRWLDRESFWWWRTMLSNVHSVGLSLRRFAKIIILGENLHFPSIICFRIFLMTGTRIHVYSYVGIPECFVKVLSWCYLILFGIAIINYLQSPFLSFSDLCMLLLGMYVSCWC